MRAYQDLREFLSVLEQQRQLLCITETVNLEPDLAAAACALTQISEASPAIHFGNIAGYTNAQVVMNVHGSWPNHALALGMDKDAPLRDQFFEFVRRYRQYPGELERVASAPWQEVVVDKDVNLFDLLPLFRINRGDGGYFLDKACVISRDPDDWDNDNIENVGVNRLQVKGRNRIGIQTVPRHDIAIHLTHAESAARTYRWRSPSATSRSLRWRGRRRCSTTSSNTRWRRSCRASRIGWSRRRRGWTYPGDRNTCWKGGCSVDSASRKAHSASSRAIIQAATNTL
jgi:3-polyprenyl-4-hydroxybenzoate decarboxylase